MRIFSKPQTVGTKTIQALREANSQSLSTQAKKRRTISSMMRANVKAFDLMGDDIVELSTENGFLRSKIGDCDEKWVAKSQTKLSKQTDDEKSANIILPRMKKQMNKQK